MAPHQLKACVQFGMLDEFSRQIIGYVPILLPQDHPGQLPGTEDQLHPGFQSWAERLLEKAPGMLSCKSPQQTASMGQCISPVLTLFHLEHSTMQKTGN